MRRPEIDNPQQRDLFTRRYSKVRGPSPAELQIQVSLIAHLRLRVRPGVIYFHIPNGEYRTKETAAKLRAMGVRAGVADLIFIWNEDAKVRVLFLELKAKGRKPETFQTIFGEDVSAIGCIYKWADTIDEALDILTELKLIKQEPKFGGTPS